MDQTIANYTGNVENKSIFIAKLYLNKIFTKICLIILSSIS
jgi:hypothetical protein